MVPVFVDDGKSDLQEDVDKYGRICLSCSLVVAFCGGLGFHRFCVPVLKECEFCSSIGSELFVYVFSCIINILIYNKNSDPNSLQTYDTEVHPAPFHPGAGEAIVPLGLRNAFGFVSDGSGAPSTHTFVGTNDITCSSFRKFLDVT